MKKSRVRAWVKETAKAYRLTEKELAKCLAGSRRGTEGLECPSWISYGAKYENGVEIGLLIYDEALDVRWENDQSKTDAYIIESDDEATIYDRQIELFR